MQKTNKKTTFFSIDPKSGLIKNYYILKILLHLRSGLKQKDGAGLAATSKVVVDIIDGNDDTSVITVKSLKTPFMEDATMSSEAVIYVQCKFVIMKIFPAGGTLNKHHNIQFGSNMITLDVKENKMR